MRSGSTLVASTGTGILAATVSSVVAYNGAEAALYYSEETRARPDQFGRVIMTTAVVTVVVELLAIILATLALPSLHVLSSSAIPLAAIIARSALGKIGGRVLLACGSIAMFDTGLAATLVTAASIMPSLATDSGRRAASPASS